MLNTVIERKLGVNYILYLIIFCKRCFFCHCSSVSTQSFDRNHGSPRLTASMSVTVSLCVTWFVPPCSLCSSYSSVVCAGVFIPRALHMVKISEANQEPSRSGLEPWHCPGLGVGRCLSGASLWGLSALKNLFVYPRVRSGFRSRALLLSAHQGPGLLPLATDKNCC